MPFSPFDFNPYFWTHGFVAVSLIAVALGSLFAEPGTKRGAFERFPLVFSALAFAVGAIAVISSVTLLSRLWAGGSSFFSDAKDSWIVSLFLAYMSVGASEEGVKLLSALALFAISESGFKKKVSENPGRFVSYAFAGAVGFALFENAAYFAGQPPTVFADGSVAYESSKALSMAFSRTSFSIPAHAFFSLVAAYGIVKSVETRKSRHAFAAFGLAAFLHAFMNVAATLELNGLVLLTVIFPAWIVTYYHVESESLRTSISS